MMRWSPGYRAAGVALLGAAFLPTASFAEPQNNRAATSGVAVAPVAADAKRPNIIFILCDDLGYGDLSCFGQKNFATPNLDRMASEGMRFTRHYASSPVCVPTRASLMLGVHTGHSPDRDHQFDRAIPDTHTMASVLRQAGYRTLHVGKWGIGGKPNESFPAHPLRRGFDAFYGLLMHGAGHVHYPDAQHPLYDGYRDATAEVSDTYSTDLYTAKAKQWIGDQVREHPKQPFFLYLAYIAPHSAFDVPDAPYPAGGGQKGGVQWPLKTNPAGKNQWIYPEFECATYDDDRDPKTPQVPWTDQMKRYATMVRRLDQATADLLQTLRDLKIDKNTLVVFTSDNGPAYDQQLRATQLQSWGPLDGFKRDLCEGGIREPTIVWWPKTVKAGAISDRPSVQYQWLSTFAQLAGVTPPATTDGISLAPLLTGQGAWKEQPYLYHEFHGPSNRVEDRQALLRKGYSLPVPDGQGAARDPWGEQQAVHIGDFVGVRAQITGPETPLRLYNVAQDPHEDHDLSGQPEHAPLLARMRSLLLTARRPQPGNLRPYDEAPLPAVTEAPGTTPGLHWRIFPGAWPWAPDVRALAPTREGDTPTLTATGIKEIASAPGAVEFTGFLTVPTTGSYRFTLEGGQKAHLWLHDARVVNSEADGANGPRQSEPVALAAGLHPIRIVITTTGKGEEVSLRLVANRVGESEAIPLVFSNSREAKTAP